MYRPDHSRVDDLRQMHALMRARPFAILVSGGPSGFSATHLPAITKEASPYGLLEFHLARPNPQCADLARDSEALIIFQGPQAYITPNWYPSKARDGKTVPTWNYAVVHAYGRPEMIDDKDWLRRHVGELTTQQERRETEPWKLSDAPESYIDAMLRGIVGFRFPISRIEGKWKMSQNRDERDRAGVAAGLRRRQEGDDQHMADIVASYA